MAELTVVQLDETTGISVSSGFTAVTAGGDSFRNTGTEFIVVDNAHATLSRTVTVDSIPDVAVVVAALTTVALGPYPPNDYNDSSGQLQLSYSDSGDSLSIKVIRLR